MNYAAIKKTDVANGPGVRVSLFVSGCHHRCEGCFNSEAWDFSYGQRFTKSTVQEILRLLNHDYIAGLSLLGGEPLHPSNQKDILYLVRLVRRQFPEKTIWCYTGYDFETEIMGELYQHQQETAGILAHLDVMVDGRYQADKRNLSLPFCGSFNQRIIAVQDSLKSGRIVLMPR